MGLYRAVFGLSLAPKEACCVFRCCPLATSFDFQFGTGWEGQHGDGTNFGTDLVLGWYSFGTVQGARETARGREGGGRLRRCLVCGED